MDVFQEVADLCPAACGGLEIRDARGRARVLHPLWLRERLPDPRVVDPRTDERLVEASEIPLDVGVVRADRDARGWRIAFSDGLETTVTPGDLARLSDRPGEGTSTTLWRAASPDRPPTSFRDAVASDGALRSVLDEIGTYGYAVLKGAPVAPDGMLAFTDRIGPLKEDNWGRIGDVSARADATDLSLTSGALEMHTDNPYRDPVPGYILLHCLTNDAEGGESIIADGFQAARSLRDEDPAAFRTLTERWVRFQYRDDTTTLQRRWPMIKVDDDGRVIQVTYANSQERVEARPSHDLADYYRARRAFFERVRPGGPLAKQFKLLPGDLLVLDNYRILHGRKGFDLATGSRHMRHASLDRDVVESRRCRLGAPPGADR